MGLGSKTTNQSEKAEVINDALANFSISGRSNCVVA